MNVRRVRDVSEFKALAGAWRALSEVAASASVFTTWEWLFTWWKHYGDGHALEILVADDGGQLRGILPVYVRNERVFGVIPVGVLRFLGTGGDTAPDDLDALLHPENAEATAEALAGAAIALGGAAVVRLTDMAPASPFRKALLRAIAGKAWTRVVEGRSAEISYLALPESFDSYLQGYNRVKRAKFRRARREFLALPGARFFVWEDPARLDAAVDRLIELHRLRWAGRATHFAFSSDAYNAFHREVMGHCHDHGWLRLYCLECGDGIIAMLYCYRFRNTVFYFQGGFDPRHADLSPGGVLMGYAIEHAVGERNTAFDMLRGQYHYKSSWAPLRRETLCVDAYRRSATGLLACLRREWLPALKRRLKPAQPVMPEGTADA